MSPSAENVLIFWFSSSTLSNALSLFPSLFNCLNSLWKVEHLFIIKESRSVVNGRGYINFCALCTLLLGFTEDLGPAVPIPLLITNQVRKKKSFPFNLLVLLWLTNAELSLKYCTALQLVGRYMV